MLVSFSSEFRCILVHQEFVGQSGGKMDAAGNGVSLLPLTWTTNGISNLSTHLEDLQKGVYFTIDRRKFCEKRASQPIIF